MAGIYLTHPTGVSPGKGNEKWKSPAPYQHMLALVMITGDSWHPSHCWDIRKFNNSKYVHEQMKIEQQSN